MANLKTYRIIRRTRAGREFTVARNIDSLGLAAEAALRLVKLQETELGGEDEFIAEEEEQ